MHVKCDKLFTIYYHTLHALCCIFPVILSVTRVAALAGHRGNLVMVSRDVSVLRCRLYFFLVIIKIILHRIISVV